LYFLLTNLQEYSYIALALIVYISSVGAPLPVSLFLLGSGAYAATGSFNIFLLFSVCLIAAVCGDSTGYAIGRIAGTTFLERLERKHSNQRNNTPSLLTRSRTYFHKHGALAIFLTRWLISALGGTLNIIAGAELYPYRSFLFLDIIGEAIGDALPLILGYIFSVTWELIGTIFGNISLLFLCLGILIILGIIAQRILTPTKEMQRAGTFRKPYELRDVK
jgi:membrane protein DedA with SNARE-associated domain